MSAIHILGICGTFMGGIAALARELGLPVSGSDAAVYPPMSTQLQALGIALMDGYRAENVPPPPTELVIGNAMTRGNPEVEAILDAGRRYTSGPQWLADRVLAQRKVLAVAGTHGKTTTTTMLAFVLDRAGLAPGFLIGGVPRDFPVSARLGAAPWFVIEADEYDTAFFDKRSKFVHYRPKIAILNNLEYDHADIFPDVAAIQRQFHHLVRIVPRNGRLIVNGEDAHLAEVLAMGAWTPIERFGLVGDVDWRGELMCNDGSAFAVFHRGAQVAQVRWSLVGDHNVRNALAAVAAANAAGVAPHIACAALSEFGGVKRRLERIDRDASIAVYDDFAHHPTAIATTLAGVRQRDPGRRVLAVMEPRSNSMRQGAHAAALPEAFDAADRVFVLARPALNWDARATLAPIAERLVVAASVDELLLAVQREARDGDRVVFMSNGGFDGAAQRFAAMVSS